MSVLNQSGEEQVECPLCMEPLEVDDLHFYPCTCGYQICRFCWNRIREGENGLCPACRKAYPENPADFTPLSQEQVAAIKTEKKAREAKRRNKTLESRRALANVRVVQKNLVFVVGLPVRLADPEILKRQEYFGKYGKIHKVVINQSTTYAGSQGPSASAYVTYVSGADALRAIQGVNNVSLDGRVLKGSLGTTKYCANFMKNQPCPKPDCMYLHELGDPKASFTKEEMHAGLHQVYERKLHNQLLAAQRDQPSTNTSTNSGNSSTNAEKGSSKEGNPSNSISTSVTINNVVNSSKSNNKKESTNGNISNTNGNSNGSGSASNGSVSSNGSTNGKDAWPSLSSSPPSDSPARKQSSPKPQTHVKSHENGTSESSSPTLTAPSKSKDTDKPSRSKETNGQSKKSKTDSKKKNSNNTNTEQEKAETHSVFENDTQYLSNELDELESDRHSLLENHDLLDNSEHSLLEDDSAHNLLDDDDALLRRPRDMLAGLDSDLLPKSPMNGYGLLDREALSYLPAELEAKELAQRARGRAGLLARHADLLHAHAHAQRSRLDHKHFVPASTDNASELLGANYHQNPNMLPFGMRIENSIVGVTMGALGAGNTLPGSALGAGYVPALHQHPHQVLNNQHQQMPQQMLNGFDGPHNAQHNEGRYLAENMDKFFTDFHKAQQMRQQQTRAQPDAPAPAPPRYHPAHHHMLSAERLEMDHKQRLQAAAGRMESAGAGAGSGAGARAAGDGDDDLDFDPFKETQKALAEMMETEMMQNTSGDNMERVRRARLPPPGFSNINSFSMPVHRHQTQHQGYNSNSAMFSDWTQMDPAIMSTSVSFGKQPAPSLSQQQQELFARFNQISVAMPNGLTKLQMPMSGGSSGVNVGMGMGARLPWAYGMGVGAAGAGVSLPPGFAPPKPPQHPAECIDAK